MRFYVLHMLVFYSSDVLTLTGLNIINCGYCFPHGQLATSNK